MSRDFQRGFKIRFIRLDWRRYLPQTHGLVSHAHETVQHSKEGIACQSADQTERILFQSRTRFERLIFHPQIKGRDRTRISVWPNLFTSVSLFSAFELGALTLNFRQPLLQHLRFPQGLASYRVYRAFSIHREWKQLLFHRSYIAV